MSISFDHSDTGRQDCSLEEAAKTVHTRAAREPALQQETSTRPLQSGAAMTSRSELIEIIEGEIIPRLFLAHRDRAPRQQMNASMPDGELGDRTFLAGLFMHGDAADIVCRLQALIGRGMLRQRIYLDLLAPVPKTLSLLWAQGRCDFDEIANGLRCLDTVLQVLHDREHDGAASN